MFKYNLPSLIKPSGATGDIVFLVQLEEEVAFLILTQMEAT